jgi:hypothetical protein
VTNRPLLLALALLALGLPAADASAAAAKKPTRLWYRLALTYDDRARTEYRDARPAPGRVALLIDNQRVSWHAESGGSILLRKQRRGDLRIAAGNFAGRLTRNEGSAQTDLVNGDGSLNCTFNDRRRLVEKPNFAGTNFSLETATGEFGMNVGPPLGTPAEIQYLGTQCGVCSGTSGRGRPLTRAPTDHDPSCAYGDASQRVPAQMGSYIFIADTALGANRMVDVSGAFGARRITVVLSSQGMDSEVVSTGQSTTNVTETATQRIAVKLTRCPRGGRRPC